MHAERSKSSSTRLNTTASADRLPRKSSDYVFRPIAADQHAPHSSFHTGLRYLKLLGHFRRQNEDVATERSPVRASALDRLERTSAFSTNYYAPLPKRATNRSIQVDDVDELSFKSAIAAPSPSCHDLLYAIISLALFVFVSFYLQINSYPMHCLFDKKFWQPFELPSGLSCDQSNISIHFVEIRSTFYQLETQKNRQSRSCLGFDVLSCSPIDYTAIPKRQIIRRNDHLSRYCQRPQAIVCNDHSLRIAPAEHKWKLTNDHSSDLLHCACVNKPNRTACFHLMISDACDVHIPWLDYCLKRSVTHSTCQAYVKEEEEEEEDRSA